ncbi:MAG: hypothetical protein L0H23_11570 [Luteimonas sp.]|nr:hypothetical protein [Luteimonas sp.]
MAISTSGGVFPRARSIRAQALLAGGLLLLGCATANAQVVEGRLELQWGDPAPASAQQRLPTRLLATLVTDEGARIALDPAQARRAAGDLYALSGRRVAVAFAPQARGVLRHTEVEVIVQADRLWQRAPAVDAAGRVVAEALVSGTTRWVTLACRFSDIPVEQQTVAFFTSQYGTTPGQLGHYWNEVSYGKINLTGSNAYGWFALPLARDAYVTMVDGEEEADLDKLFTDCAAAADPTVSFTGVQGVNMMFNGDLDGYAWGGGACATLDGARRCPRVTWNPPWSFGNLAPLAHEMGHGYGLPHSDNSDGDDDTYDNPWDVMSDAWSNAMHNVTYGALPKHINILQRDRLGWVDAARKRVIPAGNFSTTQLALDFAGTKGATNLQMIVLAMPARPDPYATVVYTLEARRRTGTYESALAGDAVILHKVEDYGTAYSVDADVPPADIANNEGSMFKPGETWLSPDHSRWIRVDAMTATGFLVTIGPMPRITGGRLPALRRTATQVVPQPLPPARSAPDSRGARGSEPGRAEAKQAMR